MQPQVDEQRESAPGERPVVKLPATKRRELSNERAKVWSGRPWPVRVLTWLLALQGLLLGLLGFFNLRHSESLIGAFGERPLYLAVVPLSLLALIAVIGFVQLRPGAWVVAMLLQGLMLLMALGVYFTGSTADAVLYAMLLYGVVMVLYLNYAEVPLIFRVQPGETPAEPVEEDVA